MGTSDSIPDVSPICVVGAITAGCGLYAQIKNGVKSGLIAIALLAIWADSWTTVSYTFLLQLVLSKEVAVGKTPLTGYCERSSPFPPPSLHLFCAWICDGGLCLVCWLSSSTLAGERVVGLVG